jgi:hypothetical protein
MISGDWAQVRALVCCRSARVLRNVMQSLQPEASWLNNKLLMSIVAFLATTFAQLFRADAPHQAQ